MFSRCVLDDRWNVTPQCDTYRGKVRRGSCCFFEKICGWLELVQRRCGSLPVLRKKRFDLSPRPTARCRAQRGRGANAGEAGTKRKCLCPLRAAR